MSHKFYEVIYEDGARSDRMFNLNEAIWEAMEHATPGEDARIEDESEYVVWTITGGVVT